MKHYAEVALPRTQVRTLYSRDGQREYRVWIALPSSPAPASGFPVLYILDANATFGTVVESLRLRSRRTTATGIVPAIVVGIAYPTDEPFDTIRRTYDYTRGPSEEVEERADSADSLPTGGADAFFEFLTQSVKAEVEHDFAIDRSRQILFSHSLSGLFALQLLVRMHDAFNTYIVVSPSIWWDRRFLFESVDTLRSRLSAEPAKTDIMISVGQYEQRLAPWEMSAPSAKQIAARRDSRRMVDNACGLAHRLSAIESLGGRVVYHEFEGEDHASGILPAVSHGLRFALGPR